MKRVFGSILLFPVLVFGFNAFKVWNFAQVSRGECPGDIIVVMGAAQYDGRPSPALQRRLDEALVLYEQGCAPRVLLTGGKQEGDRFTEGETGRSYLSERGVPEAALLTETASRTSYQNLALSAPYLSGAKAIIVTDGVHAYRVRWLAERLDYRVSVQGVEVPGLNPSYFVREVLNLSAHQVGLVR